MKLDLSNGLSEEMLARIRGRPVDKSYQRSQTESHPDGEYELFVLSEVLKGNTKNRNGKDIADFASFRRAFRPSLAGRKLIKCPYCGGLFIDVDKDARVRTYPLPMGSQKKRIYGIRTEQCKLCKNEVGISIVV